MRKKTRLLLAMTALVLTACFQPGLVAQTTTDNAAAASSDVANRVDQLEKEVARLNQEIAALKQSAPAAPAAAVPVASAAAPAAPAATPAADPMSGISSVIGGAAVTGLVDGYYAYNVNQPANHSSGLRLFDNSTNTFALNLIELGLVKTPDANSRLGYNLTFGFGNAMNVVNSTDPSFLQYLKESYLSYLVPVGKGLQVDFGKFVTPAGAEVIESNANWNYSRSLLFNYAIPFYHFGLRAKYTFNDKYSLTGYVVNGWNNVVQSNTEGKTGGLSFAWTPNKKVSLTETWLGGPGAVPVENDQWRNLSDTVLVYTPTAKLSLMANGDYGRVEGLTGYSRSVEWSGVAGYVKYQFSANSAVATRYEYYDDPDGYTTGTGAFQTVAGSAVPAFLPLGQHIQEVTGTLERRIAQHLLARLEFRHDLATQPVFLKGSSPVLDQSTVAGGLIFVLEPNR
jgi:outer membrane murein-binding lipoprotein Lpp